MNALRGHSNIQGLTDLGLMSNLLPGYLNHADGEGGRTSRPTCRPRTFKPLRPGPDELLAELSASSWSAFMKAMWGDARHRRERLGLRLPAEARRAELRHPADVRADERRARSTSTSARASTRSLAFPEPRQDHRGAVEAEVPRHHRPARHRDVALLGEPRRLQRRRHRGDRDRGDPAAVLVLRRGRGLARQLRPLAAVALAGGRAAGRGQARHLDHGADLPAGARSSTGRRAAAFPTRSSTSPGTTPTRATRRRRSWRGSSTAGRSPTLMDADRPDQGGAGARPAAARTSASCATTAPRRRGCWIYSGCWNENGNNMARRDNDDPDAHRRLRRTGRSPGRSTGASSTTAPPATWRASPGIRRASSSSGTARSGRATTCPTSRPTAKPGRGHAVHHEPGGRVAALLAAGMMRDGPFPTHMEPFESPIANVLEPEDARQPGGAGLRERRGELRHARRARGVPLRRRPPTG